jgi:hypothetical protein
VGLAIGMEACKAETIRLGAKHDSPARRRSRRDRPYNRKPKVRRLAANTRRMLWAGGWAIGSDVLHNKIYAFDGLARMRRYSAAHVRATRTL